VTATPSGDGGTDAEELARTRELEVDGIPLRVFSLERIIASKRAANRIRDLAAIPDLEEAFGGPIR
jgi:hypothetical protein